MTANILMKHHDLTIEDCGADYPGDLLLSQIGYCGEESRIQISKTQVRLLAGAVGLLEPRRLPKQFDVDCIGGDSMDQLEVEQYDDESIWIMQSRISGMGGTDAGIKLHPMQAAWLAVKLQSILGQGQSPEEDQLQKVGADETGVSE